MDTPEVLAELRVRLDTLNGYFTPKSLEVGKNFKPREDDIFVATAPKCGTTWTLQICHMLRSNGDTNFDDIMMETVFDMAAYDLDQDLNAEHKYYPRVYKSHEKYENIAKGGKYIFVTRSPEDAFLSYYHFLLQSPIVNTSTVSMEAFGRNLFDNPGFYPLSVEYIVSYVEALKNNPKNILFLFYEDMKENPRESIEKIAKFMGLNKLLEEEFKARCDAAEKYSSLKYMKEHKNKFAHVEVMRRMFKKRPEFKAALEGDRVKLVRSGKAGGGKTIPDKVKKLITKSWEDIAQKELGYTSYQEFREKFMAEVRFKPRADDIFVATGPKCGTTWTLQICHMLRSNGDTDYEDLLLETPWDVLAYDVDQDLDADHKYSPRVFKSHETYETIAKGGKYIFVTRDPYDSFLSFFHFFLQSPTVNSSTCSMKKFAEVYFNKPGIFPISGEYINSYVEAMQKYPKNVLFLFYEDMKANPRDNIEKIAKFMGLDKLSEEEFESRCSVAEKYSSYKYMKENKEKFEHKEVMRRKYKQHLDAVLQDGGVKLVRSGQSGEGKVISDEVKKLISEAWKKTVGKQLGYSSYEEFSKNFSVDL
eukprot:augustus_masked-scaffold_60-processed-gene-0.78-mRNA-1 protein AED:1.00 eAED:1.00 QI:0/0/0/0/1/1/2/0/588